MAKDLSQSEVNEIHPVVISDHEIIRLDVTMEVALRMEVFQGM